jgi:hypothetical protein
MGAIGTRLSLRPLNFQVAIDDAELGHFMPRECSVAFSPRHCEER